MNEFIEKGAAFAATELGIVIPRPPTRSHPRMPPSDVQRDRLSLLLDQSVFAWKGGHQKTRAERQGRISAGNGLVHWLDVMSTPL